MPVVYAFVVSWTLDETSLTTDLRGDFVVWETGSRENGDFLATGCILRVLLALSFQALSPLPVARGLVGALANRIHGIDSADTRGNHFLGINTRVRVDRGSINIQVVLSKHLRALIDSSTGAVEDTAEHVFRDRDLEVLPCELDGGFADVNTRGTLKDLNNGSATAHFQNLTGTFGSIW